MLIYISAVFFLLITPGPGVLTTAGVGAGYGFKAGLRYMWGIVIGAQFTMILVATGLAAAVFAIPYVRTVLLVASVSYLVYLALKIALAGANVAFIAATRPPRFVDGFLLQIINPKGYAVGTTVFSGFAFLPENILAQNIAKLLIMLAIAIPVHMIWLYAGASLKSLDLSPTVMRTINVAMAVAMLSVVALALYSEL